MADTAPASPSGRKHNALTPGRIAVIGAFAIVLAVALVGGFWLTGHTLALFFAAIVIAEALAPIVDRLERWVSRAIAVAAIYLLLIAAIAGALWYVVPNLASEAANLAGRLPEVANEVSENVDEVAETASDAGVPMIDNLESTLRDAASGLMSEIVTFTGTLLTSVTDIVLIGFMSAYWLLSRSALFAFIRSLAPRDQQDAVGGTIDAFSGTVGGYVRGEVISAVLVGVMSYTGLTIIGVDYALVLALVAALGELLPVIGPILSTIPAIVVALFDSPAQALIVAGFYLVLQQIESNVIIPNVMRNQADVPPLLTITAIAAGGSIGGILGALIAIPFAGVLKVATVQVAAPAIRRWTGATQAPTTVEEAQEEAEDEEE